MIIIERKKSDEIIIENIIQEKTDDIKKRQEDNIKEIKERKHQPIVLQEEKEKEEGKIEIIISQNEDKIIEINDQKA